MAYCRVGIIFDLDLQIDRPIRYRSEFVKIILQVILGCNPAYLTVLYDTVYEIVPRQQEYRSILMESVINFVGCKLFYTFGMLILDDAISESWPPTNNGIKFPEWWYDDLILTCEICSEIYLSDRNNEENMARRNILIKMGIIHCRYYEKLYDAICDRCAISRTRTNS